MRRWRATQARRVLAALLRIGWSVKRQSGSHRTLMREVWQEEVPGTANALLIAARFQALATDKLLMKQEAVIHAPVALRVSRGDAAQVFNTPNGINNTDILTVMTLRHHYEFDASFEKLYTLAGLRRVF